MIKEEIVQRDRIDEFFADPKYSKLGPSRVAFERIWREGAQVELRRLMQKIEAAPQRVPELAEAVSRIVQFVQGGSEPLGTDFAALVTQGVVTKSQAWMLTRLVDGRIRVLVNRIQITAKWLAGRCGASQDRTAGQWIEVLKAHGLIDVIDHDRERGHYTLDIHDPTPEREAPRPDPQKLLPLPTDGDTKPSGKGPELSAQTSGGARPCGGLRAETSACGRRVAAGILPGFPSRLRSRRSFSKRFSNVGGFRANPRITH